MTHACKSTLRPGGFGSIGSSGSGDRVRGLAASDERWPSWWLGHRQTGLRSGEGPGDPARKGGSAAARELGEVLARARHAQFGILTAATIDGIAGRLTSHDWQL